MTDSDHAGNAEVQNKRHSQLAHMQQRGKAPGGLGKQGTSVQTVAWPQEDGSLNTAATEATGPTPTCHSMVRDLHADVSSASDEIYAGSIGLSQGIWLSYVSEELSIDFPMPIAAGADSASAVAYANGTVKHSKIRHIDARQDRVRAMRDSAICKL